MPAPAVDFSFCLHTPFSAKARVALSNQKEIYRSGTDVIIALGILSPSASM